MELNNKPIDKSIVKKFIGTKNQEITTTFFYLMKELGISYNELCEMPISTIFILVDELKKHCELEKKANKKQHRKK